jgi:tetraacyldisaccharide 4'-kinase
MRLKTPQFWYNDDGIGAKLKAAALSPLSICYGIGHKVNQSRHTAYKPSIPVICIGNIVTGGSGKTPAALAIMKLMQSTKMFKKPVFLSRGYGGSLKGPIEIDEHKHVSGDVGDEPILLSKHATTIVSRDRKEGALRAESNSSDLIIMDDGLQNPAIEKDLKIIVIDGNYGFGNRKIIPAGPLREALQTGIAKADAFILIGRDNKKIISMLPSDKPIFEASINISESWIYDEEKSYVAFAGIGHPQKFYNSLLEKGLSIAGVKSYPDHYQYKETDIEALFEEAESKSARLVTTEKDAVRIPEELKTKFSVDAAPIQLTWKDAEAVKEFLLAHISSNKNEETAKSIQDE